VQIAQIDGVFVQLNVICQPRIGDIGWRSSCDSQLAIAPFNLDGLAFLLVVTIEINWTN
jgi:hypothetical protein